MALTHHLSKWYYLSEARVSVAFWTAVFLLKCRWLFIPLGVHPKVDGRVYLRSYQKGAIAIGDRLRLNSRKKSNLVGITNPATLVALPGGAVRIGNDCGFTSVVMSSREEINIGHRVKMGANVRIYDHDFHSLEPGHRSAGKQDPAQVRRAGVVIEDDVFIGTNAIILKGVHIGRGSIIGAGSVVSGLHIPPHSVVAGNPARIIKEFNPA